MVFTSTLIAILLPFLSCTMTNVHAIPYPYPSKRPGMAFAGGDQPIEPSVFSSTVGPPITTIIAKSSPDHYDYQSSLPQEHHDSPVTHDHPITHERETQTENIGKEVIPQRYSIRSSSRPQSTQLHSTQLQSTQIKKDTKVNTNHHNHGLQVIGNGNTIHHSIHHHQQHNNITNNYLQINSSPTITTFSNHKNIHVQKTNRQSQNEQVHVHLHHDSSSKEKDISCNFGTSKNGCHHLNSNSFRVCIPSNVWMYTQCPPGTVCVPGNNRPDDYRCDWKSQ